MGAVPMSMAWRLLDGIVLHVVLAHGYQVQRACQRPSKGTGGSHLQVLHGTSMNQ